MLDKVALKAPLSKSPSAVLYLHYTHTHTHTHTHTRWFLWFTGTLHRRNGFYTVQTVSAIALHLNLALTGDGAFQLCTGDMSFY